jgi:hypothetical protein
MSARGVRLADDTTIALLLRHERNERNERGEVE